MNYESKRISCNITLTAHMQNWLCEQRQAVKKLFHNSNADEQYSDVLYLIDVLLFSKADETAPNTSSRAGSMPITEEEAEHWLEYLKDDIQFDVLFDWENYNYTDTSCHYDRLIGPQEKDGIHWYGISAGGDWESSVYIALFKQASGSIMHMIPYVGNYNKSLAQAWGNNETDPEDYEASEEDINMLETQVIKHIKLLQSAEYQFLEN